MPLCPTCGKDLDAKVRFCPQDGTPLSADARRAVAPPRELTLPVVVGQRYRLVELCGGGGMAKVYRGVDQNLERTVAVKLINPELRSDPEFDARFQREAKIVSQMSDPQVVVVHDFGLDAEYGPYLVMEYLQGQTLRERLRSSGVLPLRAGIHLGAQMLLALMHAHDRNIIHRDIKPDNLFLLNQSGVRLHMRVLDFGVAHMVRGDAAVSDKPLTQPGAVLGTPRYMSPEQIAGEPIDARSDLYSAALVIFESLTGELPTVSGKSLLDLLPTAPTSLSELLAHCLRSSPVDRPASALEVYLRLLDIGKASGLVLLPPGTLDRLAAQRRKHAPPPAAPRRNWGTLLLLTAIILVGLVLAAVILLRGTL